MKKETGGVAGHDQEEKKTHSRVDATLKDKNRKKRAEEREAIREGMGRIWKRRQGVKPGAERAIGQGARR